MNDTYLVNTKRVAKQVAGAGEFMMMKSTVGNLLVTGQFILSLTEKQFWSVRCKLEVPELEQWYIYDKDGPVKSERETEKENWEQKYYVWINETDPTRALTFTGIALGDAFLYTDGMTYIAIAAGREQMLNSSEDKRMAGKMVVVDGVHVLAVVTENVWRNNGFLYRLPGIDKEQENEK